MKKQAIEIMKIFDKEILDFSKQEFSSHQNYKNFKKELNNIKMEKTFLKKIGFLDKLIGKNFCKNKNELIAWSNLKMIAQHFNQSIIYGKKIELVTGNENKSDIDCCSNDKQYLIQYVNFEEKIKKEDNVYSNTICIKYDSKSDIENKISLNSINRNNLSKLMLDKNDFQEKLYQCINKKVEKNIHKKIDSAQKANLLYIFSKWNYNNEFSDKKKFKNDLTNFFNKTIFKIFTKFNESSFKNIEILFQFAGIYMILSFDIEKILKKGIQYKGNSEFDNLIISGLKKDQNLDINKFTKDVINILKELKMVKENWNNAIDIKNFNKLKLARLEFTKLCSKKYGNFFCYDKFSTNCKNCFLPKIDNLNSTFSNPDQFEVIRSYKFYIFSSTEYYFFVEKICNLFWKEMFKDLTKAKKIKFTPNFDNVWNFNKKNLIHNVRFFYQSIIDYVWNSRFDKKIILKINEIFFETFDLIQNQSETKYITIFEKIKNFFQK